jgi:hypothetical protein
MVTSTVILSLLTTVIGYCVGMEAVSGDLSQAEPGSPRVRVWLEGAAH